MPGLSISAAAQNVFGSPSLFKTPTKSDLEDDSDEEEEDEEDKDISPQENSLPTIVTKFTCPVTEETKVLVLVTLPSGVTSCTVNLDCVEGASTGNGGTNSIKVTFDWGRFSFQPEDLYHQKIDSGELEATHPKLLAVKQELKKLRSNVTEAPSSSIHISLPLTVQVTDNKWTYNTISNQDQRGFTTQVLEVELTELQTTYTSNKNKAVAEFTLQQSPRKKTKKRGW